MSQAITLKECSEQIRARQSMSLARSKHQSQQSTSAPKADTVQIFSGVFRLRPEGNFQTLALLASAS